MDAIDKRILTTLQEDGRIPIIDLAERVGLTPTPCARRIARMEAEGIITGYTARVDQTKLGYPLTVFVFVELDRQSQDTIRAFERAVARFDEVVECHLMTGTRDILLKVVAPDLTAFDQFLEHSLMNVPGIRATRSSFSLRQMVAREVVPVG
ncbi:winged helix-turn-helix transcriptional regulator [Roseobacter sp. HKCCD9010]|uniref:Lrp/AsnC family transcriptional regulator n=1 Tax=unclassified Roseobacter TaxID=196798 RepID=UPI0014914F49|nr:MULTISPECIES: Lrp/AsnC family transcriptional regulator [unclassified Roseobacter]MBF9051973.1 winged helix-turn-helix transcriptional regulator [Rhodobacterales bacterium HKCCD4356]NNV10318.1 winged helix-turn-helix transcriptional regulator [Roseobacter sp. HKCCD7357]NNV18138.1 winged helix-turn-helix transcriptional regulator [Roseobacter sp. HKCCD8768]NNV27598.1 winged helix-turn-helix transcriptional regulator [Roseobacter sp. HKCCD8192]NNV31864.1 winged helix-turn-helix transcriptiona